MNPYTPVLGGLEYLSPLIDLQNESKLYGTKLFLGEKRVQAKKMHLTDCKEDMYALGVLTYSILNGLVEEEYFNTTILDY